MKIKKAEIEDLDIVVKLKPSATGKLLYEKFGFYDSGEMELWIS